VIEASKQCGRNRLMLLDEPLSWPDFIARSSAASIRLLAHGEKGDGGEKGEITDIRELFANHTSRDMGDMGNAAIISDVPISVIAAVGPEGGLTEEEVSAAISAGWRMVGLGPRTLRVETAAIALAAAIAASFAPGA
jgi:16S rRNA (uracil1498-N3)-methyltransferase